MNFLKNLNFKFAVIAVAVFALFWVLFSCFQNNAIYSSTLGQISSNYERVGTWDNYKIIDVDKPFVAAADSNYDHWDGAIYKTIKDYGYTPGKGYYQNVRAAFFPLFPLIWKITGTNSIGVSIINYFLFALSLVLLLQFFYKGTDRNKLILFAIAIALPSSIIYMLPYSEATFMLATVIGVFGMLKRKYWIYFIGFALMAMTRPATIFVFLTILTIDLIDYLRHKNGLKFAKELGLKVAPFAAGFAAVIIIQYFYSGSWDLFLQAQKYWSGGLSFPKDITDWSVEGFGLSSFAFTMVSLPALAYCFLWLIGKTPKIESESFFSKIDSKSLNEYLFLMSCMYLASMLTVTLFYSGGNLHSLFRFTITSPFFYIAFFLLPERLDAQTPFFRRSFFWGIFSLLLIFLFSFEYGNYRIIFPFLGMVLFVLDYAFYLYYQKLGKVGLGIIGVLLLLLNTVWNTFLFNSFLSNGWLFT